MDISNVSVDFFMDFPMFFFDFSNVFIDFSIDFDDFFPCFY